MLKALNSDQAHFIALLAKAARDQRDKMLDNVAEKDLADVTPARGEHDPAASLGFAPLAPEAPPLAALREAITSLSRAGRSELYALARIGQGDLAVAKWKRGLAEAAMLGDETVIAALVEDQDLHNHLAKALYEANLGP
jgi:hypothetical protein